MLIMIISNSTYNKRKQSKEAKKMSNTQTPTPSCKFCQGAGEPKAMYTSHWQFSKPVDGKLTCPKLLSHKCKCCNETGHIEKRCPFPKQKKQQQQSKFCRFCCNAGHAEYTEHNQFDKDGFVTCPALIDIECQQCGKKGHTKKYCGTAVATPKKAEKIITAPKKPANKFSALNIEEDDEAAVPLPDIDILQSKNLEKFPCLPTGGKSSQVAALTGWAKMAAMPAKKLVATITPPVVAVKNEARLAEYDGWTDDEEDVHTNEPQTESTSWADW